MERNQQTKGDEMTIYGKKTNSSIVVKTIDSPKKSNVHGGSLYHVINDEIFGGLRVAGLPVFVTIDESDII